MADSRTVITGLPKAVCEEKIQESLRHFLALKGIYDVISHIHYIGGCSNHALKITTSTPKNETQHWLVRLPGSQSDILINRDAERHNTAIVANLGICPVYEKRFLAEGSVLQAQGYKVEDYLENATSLTHDTFTSHRKKALAALKKVHQCKQVFLTEYNLLERIKMMCYSLQCVGSNEITTLIYAKGRQQVKLSDILNDINVMERLRSAFGKLPSVPCHNDIPPFNFMKIENGNDWEIKIIDWEYAGMNDPMCELAYIANENHYVAREDIKALLLDYYDNEKISEDELAVNMDRIQFYLPLIDLKVAVWSLVQVNLCNQSHYIEELREGWGPDRYLDYLEKRNNPQHQEVMEKLAHKLSSSISKNSIFTHKN